MKNKAKFLSGILCASMLLGGCGSSGGSDGYTLSECLNSGETIWYSISGEYGKSASVSAIFVMEKDGSMYYATTDKKLGELEQMKDKDIAEMVKQDYETEMSERIDTVISELEEKNSQTYSGAAEWILEDLKHIYMEAIYCIAEENEVSIDEMMEGYYDNQYNELIKEGFEEIKTIYSQLDTEEDAMWVMEEMIYSEGSEVYSIMEETATEIYDKEVEAFEASKSDYESVIAKLKEYQADIKPAEYKLSIITDATGNSTQSEVLAYQVSVPLTASYTDSELTGYSQEVVTMTLNYSLPYENPNGGMGNCFEVYDSWYGMYLMNDRAFCIRTDENTTFSLDGVETKNIAIDNTESLFDTSNVITME